MEKRIDKATERALKAYPKATRDIDGIVVDIGHPQYMRDLYIEGYQQAEKDLTDISWIKEVSGVKELSRAKEEALKAYPPKSIAANYDTMARRDAFEYGYLKAEKDNELTWEDISKIISIDQQVCGTMGISDYTHNHQQAMEEVLKRFEERKENDIRRH